MSPSQNEGLIRHRKRVLTSTVQKAEFKKNVSKNETAKIPQDYMRKNKRQI